jgi:hypothetical protein
VHGAKSFEKFAGGSVNLTPIQSKILEVLKKTGGSEPTALPQKLGGKFTLEELHREFAALRHMEKVRAEKRGGRVFWCLW